MRETEKLLAIVREAWEEADRIARCEGGAIHDVRLRCDARSTPVLQVVYSLPLSGGRLGVEFFLPRDSRDQEIRELLEGFFYDLIYEPTDMTRGMWIDGVWWWAPGTVPLPRLDS